MAAPTETCTTVEIVDAPVEKKTPNLLKTALFVGAACGSFVLGFGFSLHRTRGSDPTYMKKGRPDMGMLDAGTRLAGKAVMVGTVLSVAGVSLLVLGTFKLFGVKNFYELNDKIREYYPKAPPQGRSDFKNLQDLTDYLISEDRKAELEKKQLLEAKEMTTD